MIGFREVATDYCDSRSAEWPADLRDWLSASEIDEYARWRNPQRRTEWLAGRWLLKSMLRRDCEQLLARAQTPHLRELEVLSRDAAGRSQSPRVLVAGRALAGHVSLSHVDGIAWAAVSPSANLRVGIDIVRDGETFKRPCDTWFTPREREWIRHTAESGLAAVLWSAKEAAYKATNLGETFIPGQYEILQDGPGRFSWIRLDVLLQNSGGVIVRRREGLTVTLATFSLTSFALRMSP